MTSPTFGFSGGSGKPLLVTMSCATSGATIFYTENDFNYVTPTHSGATATGSTLKYSGPVSMACNQEKYFSAIGYKAGMSDSLVAQRFITNPCGQGPSGNAPNSSNTYRYDAQNRLTSVTMMSGNTESFVYDGLNRKISQTINGVTTYNVWDG